MLTNENFERFSASFINYIKTGQLYQDFDTVENLEEYIRDSLNDEQRYQLWNYYIVNVAAKSSWSYKKPVWELGPRAFNEGMIAAITITCGMYKATEDTPIALGFGSFFGLLWTTGRLVIKESSVKTYYSGCEERIKRFNLPKQDPTIPCQETQVDLSQENKTSPKGIYSF